MTINQTCIYRQNCFSVAVALGAFIRFCNHHHHPCPEPVIVPNRTAAPWSPDSLCPRPRPSGNVSPLAPRGAESHRACPSVTGSLSEVYVLNVQPVVSGRYLLSCRLRPHCTERPPFVCSSTRRREPGRVHPPSPWLGHSAAVSPGYTPSQPLLSHVQMDPRSRVA